ncbi:23S rRNA (guanosine(2251)-2'-O)-methyltransferase RlmB [Mariniphaga sediminis]|jgi:23S rRNA (guanosine2251-2'-O)-methyltransferase|uniref:23S rRNA (Guanosine(2251)-2'-O)-methyltransferase RlmB n=1 Tax=Mariniphaga sediminis TaxID=1628158 RepID=A0A399CUM3_9BACT|nr:23S rRNA (guanosine(2251)-2'-O)-methyltransferase RlmB [Mariniphaga sediminis]RIH63535.1 23S rRNA (guanosine(2251)-2'-O)-methyltransferase RlmB [Mariniphaga sediminis]
MQHEDYIFGTRAVIEAVKSGRRIEKVLIRKGLDNPLFSELFQLIKENEIPFQFVPVEKINRVTRKNHQGVLAFLSAVEFDDIETLLPGLFESGVDPFILILDQVTDVRNFGAIVRTAECGGVQAIVIPEKGMARIGADAVKTSAGAIHSLPVCRVKSLGSVIRFLKDSGLKIVASTEKASTVFTDSEMNVPLAIIMGSEDTGISSSLLKMADEQVRIPLYGKIESLNVSVAAALMIYEAVRQRN